MYKVIIDNNFSVNNRYVISEQCCSVLVSTTNWIFSENSWKNTNLITKYMAIEIWSYLGSKLSNKVHEHTCQIRCFCYQNMVKFLYIFILYIVAMKIAAAIFFRKKFNIIISISYKKVIQCVLKKKTNLVPQISQIFEFCK